MIVRLISSFFLGSAEVLQRKGGGEEDVAIPKERVGPGVQLLPSLLLPKTRSISILSS